MPGPTSLLRLITRSILPAPASWKVMSDSLSAMVRTPLPFLLNVTRNAWEAHPPVVPCEAPMVKRFLFLLLALAPLAAWSAQPDLSKTPLPPGDLVPKDAKPAAAGVVCFLEGPAADADGNLFFSDI